MNEEVKEVEIAPMISLEGDLKDLPGVLRLLVAASLLEDSGVVISGLTTLGLFLILRKDTEHAVLLDFFFPCTSF